MALKRLFGCSVCPQATSSHMKCHSQIKDNYTNIEHMISNNLHFGVNMYNSCFWLLPDSYFIQQKISTQDPAASEGKIEALFHILSYIMLNHKTYYVTITQPASYYCLLFLGLYLKDKNVFNETCFI